MDADVKQQQPATPAAFRIVGDAGELFSALIAARGEFRPLEANQEGKVERDGRVLYTYDYADLAELQAVTTPGLGKNGLVITQPWWSDGDGYVLLTMLAHKTGAYMATETWFPKAGTWQQLGSSLSYLKRYQWCSILGIATRKDDDDAAAAGPSNGAKPASAARPATRAPVPKSAPRPQGSITDAQLNDITEMARELDWNQAVGETFMKGVLGYVAELPAIPKEDADRLIKAMVEEQKKPRSAP